MRSLAFVLPPPALGRSAAHYYLQVNVSNAADAATPAHWGSPSFARGNLFYFWIDAPTHTSPLCENATRAGIMAGSQAPLQTAAISKTLNELVRGWRLCFPTALFRTASFTITDGQGLQLGQGAILQHPAPSITRVARAGGEENFAADKAMKLP
eukprot:SAG31_NODE_25442_length_461_cov_0.986188_1_plen_153_part_11